MNKEFYKKIENTIYNNDKIKKLYVFNFYGWNFKEFIDKKNNEMQNLQKIYFNDSYNFYTFKNKKFLKKDENYKKFIAENDFINNEIIDNNLYEYKKRLINLKDYFVDDTENNLNDLVNSSTNFLNNDLVDTGNNKNCNIHILLYTYVFFFVFFVLFVMDMIYTIF